MKKLTQPNEFAAAAKGIITVAAIAILIAILFSSCAASRYGCYHF